MLSYLPKEYLPDDWENVDFDDFFRLYAIAEVSREMKRDDLEIAVNHGCVSAFGDAD